MQGQIGRIGDGVVDHPLLARPIGAGDHQAVQGGGEDGARDRELEGAVGEEGVEHRPDASVPPQPAEQKWRADPPADEPLRVAVRDRRKHEGSIGEVGHRGGEALERAAGEHGLLAAEVLDDLLPGARPLTHALDEVEIGVAVDGLLAHEHEHLAAHHQRRSQSANDPWCHYLAAQLSAAKSCP
jgi:hypothetical protein